MALVAGNIRVPKPAIGMTAAVIFWLGFDTKDVFISVIRIHLDYCFASSMYLLPWRLRLVLLANLIVA